MIAPRILSLAAALVVIASVDVFAQQEPPVAPGDRVRVTAPTEISGRFVGTVMEIGADTCVLEVEGRAEALALPLASVTSLEVWRERESKAGEGAAWGLFIGGVGGAAFGVLFASLMENPDRQAGAMICGGVGAGAGLLLGAATGAVKGMDDWEVVPVDQLRVDLVRQRNGRLGVAISSSIRL